MRKAALYLRVSTIDQTTANQERELRDVAARMGCEIVKVYKDHGISGAKGRDKRPAFDSLCRDATKRQFDLIMAWSVDRLGRSLQDLVGFLSEIPRAADRSLPPPAGARHDDPGRQGDVSDDGRFRRVRAGNDRRARPGRDGAGPRERDKERQRHWPATHRWQARGEDSRPSRLWQGYLQHCGRGWCWRCDGAADQGGDASLIARGEPTQSPRLWGSWGHITASRGPFRSAGAEL